MELKELVKAGVIAGVLCVGVPAGAFLLYWRPVFQRWAFGLLCFLTIGGLIAPNDLGLTLHSIETYRGHVRGFHFYLYEAVLLSLLGALLLKHRVKFVWFPRGLWLYLLFCAGAAISVINAPDKILVAMSVWKYGKLGLVLVVAYNYFQREEDLFFFTRVMAWVMLWELLVVLKMRYGDGIYRVAGTFEHQNSLVMFSNMVAMVFLALGLDPQGKHRRLYLGAFAGCAIITLLTVSRAGAAFFVLGTLILIGGFTLARPSIRTAALSGLLLVALLFGGLKAMDTFLGRVRAEGTESREDLRAVMNRISWKMAKDHPLGIGWNNWVLAVTPPNEYSADMAQWQMEAGHRVRDDSSYALVESHWFLILSENGFHSLIIFGVFLASFLWQGLRSVMYFKGTHIGSLISGVTVGCLVNYLESFFEHVLAQPRNALLWFIFLAVTARLDWWRRRRVLDRHSILENPANTRGRTTLELPPKMLSPSPIRP